MPHQFPFFSIIIPTRNRAQQLDYPHDRFEVIVINDGGEEALDPVFALRRDRRVEQIAAMVERHAQRQDRAAAARLPWPGPGCITGELPEAGVLW